MTKRTFTLLLIVFCGTLVALAQPEHHSLPTTANVSTLDVTIQEWPVPTKGGHPHDPAVGPDGALWFTEQMANKLGRLDPKTGTMQEYPLPTDKNSGPHGLVADKEGNIWFTANFGGYIGKLDPRTGKVTEYKMPLEKARIPRHSMRMAFCGLPCRAATWSGAWIRKPEKSH
jgi:virginiamycin B lyase